MQPAYPKRFPNNLQNNVIFVLDRIFTIGAGDACETTKNRTVIRNERKNMSKFFICKKQGIKRESNEFGHNLTLKM